jgi:hypothetical protein
LSFRAVIRSEKQNTRNLPAWIERPPDRQDTQMPSRGKNSHNTRDRHSSHECGSRKRDDDKHLATKALGPFAADAKCTCPRLTAVIGSGAFYHLGIKRKCKSRKSA